MPQEPTHNRHYLQPEATEQQRHQEALITISKIETGWLVKSREGWFAFPSMLEVSNHLFKIEPPRSGTIRASR